MFSFQRFEVIFLRNTYILFNSFSFMAVLKDNLKTNEFNKLNS